MKLLILTTFTFIILSTKETLTTSLHKDDVAREYINIKATTEMFDGSDQPDENILSLSIDRCSPNDVKFEECNFCKCALNGRGWLCTRWDCSGQDSDE
ncbi:CLUMA_CG010886, isoform A [Clunio marinus]|uniref:CLUMA_CG010886, isoform A n=1 Tax=Clunio marinus TaxID=568069 RepID=A0A1J1IGB8_9DIPT|nr:CLUMA_CG010886, isoform A [Clunio marinus]